MSMNNLFMKQEPKELAFLIGDRYLMIQECDDGYDYSICDMDYHLLDGGICDNPDISIIEALKEIVDDLKRPAGRTEDGKDLYTEVQESIYQRDVWIPVNYEELSEKVEMGENNKIKEAAVMSKNHMDQILNFEEFVNGMVCTLQEKLNYEKPCFSVNTSMVYRANESYHGLNIVRVKKAEEREPKCVAVLNFNLDLHYEQYKDGMRVEEIAEDIIRYFMETEEDNAAIGHMTERISDFENIKEHLYLRVMNVGRSKEYLKDYPYVQYGDVAVVCAVELMHIERGDLVFNVSHNLMCLYEQQGITFNQLYTYASKNANKVRPMIHFRPSEIPGFGSFIEKEFESDLGEEHCIFISNEKGDGGAAVLFYDGMMQKVTEFIGGGDYFILPCSIHELMCFKYEPQYVENGMLEDMELTVRNTNVFMLEDREILSDHVYFYEAATGEFSLAIDKFDK